MGILIISAGIIGWFIAVRLQEINRYPVADKIIQDKLREFQLVPFDELAKLAGKGYVHENRKIDKVTYYLGYTISRPQNYQENTDQGELVDAILIRGYVDCVTLAPIVYLKKGLSFSLPIEKRLTTK